MDSLVSVGVAQEVLDLAVDRCCWVIGILGWVRGSPD